MSNRIFFLAISAPLIFFVCAQNIVAQNMAQSVQNVSLVSESSSSAQTFFGNPQEITEYRGPSPDALKKYSVMKLEGGRITSEKIFNSDGTEKSQTVRSYTEGKLAQIVGYDAQGEFKWSYAYVYDAQGNLIEETSFDSEKNIEWKERYEFNQNGEPISRKRFSKDGKLNLVEEVSYTTSGQVEEYGSKYADGKILKRIKFFYNESGLLEKQDSFDSGGLYESAVYSYDAGKISEIKKIGANENLKETETRFYQEGRLVYFVSKNSDGTTARETMRLYDWNGNLVFEKNEGGIIFREYKY